ncbi:IQ domain-containing protein IQM3-like protein [Tanacetum coccineum]
MIKVERLLILSAYAPSMPPLFSLPLSWRATIRRLCDDGDMLIGCKISRLIAYELLRFWQAGRLAEFGELIKDEIRFAEIIQYIADSTLQVVGAKAMMVGRAPQTTGVNWIRIINVQSLSSHERIMALDLPHGGHISHGYQAHTKKKITREGQKDENLNIVKLQRLDVGEGKELIYKDAQSNFVVQERENYNASNRLYAGEKKKGKFHHSSFLAGGATLAAGRLDVDNGTLEAEPDIKPPLQTWREFWDWEAI